MNGRIRALSAGAAAALLAALTSPAPAAASTPLGVSKQPAPPIHSSAPLTAGGQTITVNPLVMDFGTVMPGSPPGQSYEVVIYVGSQTAPAPNFYGFNITGPNAGDFYVTQNFCGAGQHYGCGIYIAFAPSAAAGARTATFLIYDDMPASPQAVTLKGAVAAAGVSLSTSQVDLGTAAIGSTSAAQSFTVTSTGTGPLNVSQVLLQTVNPQAAFAITSQNCTGRALAPGSTCSVSVNFAPTQAGQMAATVQIISDAPGYHAVGIIGNAAGPQFSWLPVDFRGLNIGLTKTEPMTVSNSGNADLVISKDVIGGANAGNFSIASDSCVSGPVHPNSTCEIDVTAHATAAGSFSATLTATDNTPAGSHVVSLVMHGVNAAVSLSATSLDFGVVPHQVTGTLPLTLTSKGPDPLSITDVSIASPNSPDFWISPSCQWTDVASGTSCTMQINFYSYYPVGSYMRTAMLTVNDSTGSHQIALTATVNGPAFGFSVDPMNFGTATHGSPVTLQQTVTNTGNASGPVLLPSPSSNTGDYTVANNNCVNVTLAPGASCTFSVSFDPQGGGDRSAFFYVNNGTDLAFFRVTGTGLAPALTTYYLNTFPNTPWKATSAPMTGTFTNSGGANWNVTSIGVVDTVNFGVAPGTDHCSGTSVAPGASCTVGFTFSPSLPRHWQTTLTFNTNIPNLNNLVSIDGTGIAPWAGMSPSAVFGKVEVTLSKSISIPVRNIQEAHLHVTGVTFGSASAGFALTSQTCQDVPRDGTCQLNVQFAPTAVGAGFSSMTLIDDELNPQSVSLLATAVAHAACTGGTLAASPGSTAAIGTAVTFYAGSSTCALPVYQFLLQPPGGTWSIVQPWSQSGLWSWNTAGLTKGAYQVQVQIKDMFSTTVTFDTSATATEQIDYLQCSAVTIASDQISPSVTGASIMFTASAASCASPTFAFWMLAPGSSTWVPAQAYSTNPTLIWNTRGLPVGLYHFIVWARDARSSGAASNFLGSWDAYALMQYLVTLTPACTGVTGYVSPAGPSNPGTQITISATAINCHNPQYEFWLLVPGFTTWQNVSTYSWANTLYLDTTGAIGGTYYVSIWVQDFNSSGTGHNALGSWDAYTTASFSLTTTPCTAVSATTSMNGTYLTITAAASGCPNPLYALWVLPPGSSNWLLFSDYTASNQWTVNLSPPGVWRFSVWAVDSSSPGTYGNSLGRWDAYAMSTAT